MPREIEIDTAKDMSELIEELMGEGIPEGMEFNLDAVALSLPNCEYEPEQFPGVIYRVKEPRAVILLFSSGKIVCSGAKSEHDAWEAVRKLLRELEKYGLIEEEEEW